MSLRVEYQARQHRNKTSVMRTGTLSLTCQMKTSTGDPSLKSGNGIPSRCVYLEEMAVELEDQDWLDMSNVEQVPPDYVPSAEQPC